MYRKFCVSDADKLYLESTSKGNQRKWIYDNCFLKADTMGYESIAEYTVSDFLHYAEGVDFTEYMLCEIYDGTNTYPGCYSENFLQENEECWSFFKILKVYFGSSKAAEKELQKRTGKVKYDFVIDIVSEVSSLDINSYISNVLLLDCLTLNEDRHLNNLCVIKGKQNWRVCPVFDNGLSLLSDTGAYPTGVPVRTYINKVKSKPFSSDFIKQASYAGGKLIIDFKKYCTDLENKSAEFKNKEFGRATSVLLSRCRKLEGTIWEQKH